jgi:hypothetical protein
MSTHSTLKLVSLRCNIVVLTMVMLPLGFTITDCPCNSAGKVLNKERRESNKENVGGHRHPDKSKTLSFGSN